MEKYKAGKKRKKITSEEDQNTLPPNTALAYIDYFELKATENQEIQKDAFLELPLSD